MQSKRSPEGIEVRHAKRCRSREGERCNCRPTYQASVWSNADRRRTKRTFPNLSAAKAWRRDAQVAIERGQFLGQSSLTLEQAAQSFIIAARDGTIRSRKGTAYKPSAVRSYERVLRLRVLPSLGHRKLSEIRRRDVQAFADDMLVEGLAPETIKKTLDPLRAI